ncbi:unnamed protein product [Orchesella dallaii]|uniref:Uncharacterized protein n=1 Tax=Orchesella dallaii TaxID=48710 RepID=A0ABP1RX41_9HEXA
MDQVTKPTITMTKEENRCKLFFVISLHRDPKFVSLRKRVDEVGDLFTTYKAISIRQYILPIFFPALRERLKEISLKFSEISDMFSQWYKPLKDAMNLAHHLQTELRIWESSAVDRTLEMRIENLLQLALADNRFHSTAAIDFDKMTKELEDLNLIPKFRECVAEMKELDARLRVQMARFSGGGYVN